MMLIRRNFSFKAFSTASLVACSMVAVCGLSLQGGMPKRGLPKAGIQAPRLTVQRLAAPHQLLAQKHKKALLAYGITDLKGLGNLKLSGNVMPQRGLATPDVAVNGSIVPFLRANQVTLLPGKTARSTSALSGQARLVNVRNPSAAARAGTTGRTGAVQVASSDIPLDTAYWAAEWIDLADGTNVVLKLPNRHLVIITRKLTVGQNVTFTYERSPDATPAKPPKPIEFRDVKMPFGKIMKVQVMGLPGTNGEKGASFENQYGPEVEVWALEMIGSPAFDLGGQKGGLGGPGGDGVDGEAGTNGSNGNVSTGAGDGGNGGNGGRAGNGGPGGNGANGGKFALYTPQNFINTFLLGYYIDVSPGDGGAGGPAGLPGAGGTAGHAGSPYLAGTALQGRTGSDGQPGAGGQPGQLGSSGKAGTVQTDPIRMVAITNAEYLAAFSSPHITTVSSPNPNKSHVLKGDTVTVSGENFSPTDIVVMQGVGATLVSCQTQVVSDTLLTFKVGAAPGELRFIQVRRTDGTLSNKATVYVLPTLDISLSGKRLQPGQITTLTGSGFSQGMRIRVITQGNPSGEDMSLNGAGQPTVTFVDGSTIKWKVTRPLTGIPAQPGGEAVQIVAEDASRLGRSGKVPVVLDTYRILIFGDSIAWGQGLLEQDKFHTIVENRVKAELAKNLGNIKVYKTSVAHSGALLGAHDTGTGPALYGEVPHDYPTVKSQAEQFMSLPDAPFVDLIIMDGGHNDLGFNRYGDKDATEQSIAPVVDQVFLGELSFVLQRMAQSFTTAKIVVTGYYQVVSDQSDFTLLARVVSMLNKTPVRNGTLEHLSSMCAFVTSRINTRMGQAVAQVNTSLLTPRLYFVDPGFSAANALYVPNTTLLFKIDDPLEPKEIREARVIAVDAVTDPSTISGLKERTYGRKAAAAHPNQQGAQQYAREILKKLGLYP